MKIRKLWLDGYGCFAEREFSLSPSLQVIAGPNEQGKTTMRSFIGDMLYGQKSSPTQRRYEDSNQLRLPWDNPECYGGRLVYELDDGREIEIRRNFDRKREAVQVYDVTNAEDMTASFPLEKNREPAFAEAHLNLTKKVFLSLATIGYLNLDGFGDKEALAQIQEKLLSLADSGEEECSADGALKVLQSRVASIGQKAARTKPLPHARARLAELEREYDEAVVLRGELESEEEKRRAILNDIEALRVRRRRLEEQLGAIEHQRMAQRFEEAQEATARIDATTQACFSLGKAREFPLAVLPELQRVHNQASTAALELQRTQNELDELESQLDSERSRLGGQEGDEAEKIAVETEERLAEFEVLLLRLHDQQEEARKTRDTFKDRMDAASTTLAALPDFSHAASDPIEWVTGLTSTLYILEQRRSESKQRLDKLCGEVDGRTDDLSSAEIVFANCGNLQERVRDFELDTRGFDEQTALLRSRIESLESVVDEHEEKLPGHCWMAALCALLLAGAAYVYFAFTPWVAVFACFVGITFAWFLGNSLYALSRMNKGRKNIDRTKLELEVLVERGQSERATIEEMMDDLVCQTPRELEACFERYRQAKAQLEKLTQARDEQAEHFKEADSEFENNLSELKSTFEKLGEPLADASGVRQGAASIISRYQEYRDAKRRLAENRDLFTRHKSDYDRITSQLEEVQAEDVALSMEVRRVMRESGYPEESNHASALKAVRAYRIKHSQAGQRHGRVAVLEEKAATLKERLAHEQAEAARLEGALTERLEAVGATSMEACHSLAEDARKYDSLRKELTVLEERRRSALQGESLEALRALVEDGAVTGAYPEQDAVALKREMADVQKQVDGLSHEEHGLHIALTERASGARLLGEIEEELAEARWRAGELELELNATIYAMTAIEEAARRKHSQIAPRLASAASGYLSGITDGAYDELLVSRDLQVSVRIPQTRALNENPGRMLSTGTVDQIYLALRLAMVAGMSEGGESIPILLDDPFSSYDDTRLENALMLLARVAETSQVLLFTCRKDIVAAAREVEASVISL